MAFHIVFFLKSLRILEEFRKNPHIKIPPKSPCRNSQSIAKFKNPLEFKNQFLFVSSPGIQPDHPSFPCTGPSILQAATSLASLFDPCAIGVFLRIHFPFRFVLFSLAPCPSPLTEEQALLVRSIPFLNELPEPATPPPLHTASSCPAPQALILEMLPYPLYSPP
jgi:hypothetical protein